MAVYPTDLSDFQWSLISPFFLQSNLGRPSIHSKRQIVNALLYLLKAGCSWDMLPKEYPSYKTVFDYFRKWKGSGFWEIINGSLNQQGRCFLGKKASPSLLLTDSQSVKGSSGEQENKGIDGYKKVNGRKRHLVVDTLGLIVGCHITAANVHDSKALEYALEKSFRDGNLKRCKKILGDKAYRGDLEILIPMRFGILLEIGAAEKHPGFLPKPKRWIVERTHAWLGNVRRLVKDYEKKVASATAWVYIANIRLVLRKLEKTA